MDLLNLLALNAANSAFNQQLLFADSNAQLDDLDQQESPKQQIQGGERTQKRRRLRRHPVWTYFGDIGEKVVGCKLCSFNTVSAFSTNLKMHLKSHHKLEFIEVMEKELDQLSKENEHCDRTSPNGSDLDTGAPRGKRRRKTVQELQETINRAKQTLERDRGHHRSFTKNSYITACAKPSTSPFNLDNTTTQSELQLQNSVSPVLSTQVLGCKEEPTAQTDAEPAKVDLHSLILMLKTLEQDSQTNKLANAFRKNLQEAAFLELVAQIGPNILTPAFQDFVYTLDPSFTISDQLLQQTNTATNTKSSA